MFQQFTEQTCYICEQLSAGRCPDCHHRLCIQHFPLDQHTPCRERQERHAESYVCYVCGEPVRPTQWSSNAVAHYFDEFRCNGCKRYICDEHHTRRKVPRMVIARDGMASNRYHYTIRYCDLCSPLRHFQGLNGLAGWTVAGLAIALGSFFWFHH